MTSRTNVATETLRALHRVQRQLADLRERLARGPRIVKAHEANLQKLESSLEEAAATATAMRIAVDEKQLQLSSSETSIEKRRQQLTEASSNVEYQALKDDIAAIEMTNSVLTDEILEAMEKLDDLNDKASRAEAAVSQGRQEVEKAQGELEQQQPLIQGDIERLEAELARGEGALPGDFRDLYFRVVRAKRDDALAAVEGEYCRGCNQQVPVNMINQMMLSHPVACISCGRLLYLPEDSPYI